MILKFASGLRVPESIVTESVAILAVKGAGKSNAAVVLAEELYAHDLPWVAIDPKGDWWGVRSGSHPLEVPVLGGLHGDLPLESQAGAFIAELIVSENLTCVLDVSEFESKAAQQRFLADLGERLYRLHGRDPQPRHLILEEADEIVPQRVFREMARTVGAWTRIVKMGRQRGLGITLVSQRSAVINKDALTQTGTLIVLRTTSPQDRKAILGWVEYHDVAREMIDSLPTLKDGEAWVCSPHLLGVVERVKIRRRRTFDSGATPVAGKQRKATRLADIDLGALQARMADTVERAKADDPKELRQEIQRLRAELKQRPAEQLVETITETVEVPVLADAELERLEGAAESLSTTVGKLIAATNEISAGLGKLKGRATAVQAPAPQATAPTPRRAAPSPVVADREFQPTSPQQRILNSLAMLEAIGVMAADKSQLALFAGTKPTSGGYKNNLGALRNQGGLIDYPTPGTVALTPAGRTVADGTDAPSSTPELHALVRQLVPPAQMTIIQALVDAYPDALTREELAEAAGAPVTSGGFKNNLGRLRTLGLIDYPSPGLVVATRVLFLETAA